MSCFDADVHMLSTYSPLAPPLRRVRPLCVQVVCRVVACRARVTWAGAPLPKAAISRRPRRPEPTTEVEARGRKTTDGESSERRRPGKRKRSWRWFREVATREA